jgi:hypothetical protein
MHISRIITGLVATGLLGVSPLAVGAPASATVNLASSVTFQVDDRVVEYGGTTDITGAVTGSDGATVYDGTVTLYTLTSTNPTWVPVATDDASGFFWFQGLKPATNSQYKVVYSGYTATASFENNYSPSEAAPAAVGVRRKVTANNRRTTFFGKVTPDYAHKAVKVERKFGKNWRTYKVLKTSSRGKWSIKLPAPSRRKTWWRFTVKSDSNYLGWQAKGWTVRY